MMKFLATILILGFGTLEAAQVTEVHTKTSNCLDCGMVSIVPGVDLEIIQSDLSSCSMFNLNYKVDGFKPASIDVFHTEIDLESCYGFEIPDKTIGLIQLFHHYTDAWSYEWVRVYFEDNTFVTCPNTEGTLSNSTMHILTCA